MEYRVNGGNTGGEKEVRRKRVKAIQLVIDDERGIGSTTSIHTSTS
jgi:hypothetical protein